MPLIQETVFPKVLSEVTFLHCGKQRAITGGHVLDELRHLQGEVELGCKLRVTLLQFNKVLLKLVVAKQRVVEIGRVVDDSASELRRSGTHSQCQHEQANQNLSFSLEPLLLSPSQIGRHLVVVVIGQCEIAREIDFDSVAFPDGHRGHDVQKLLEDLCRRLRRRLRESLAHEVGIRCGERTRGPCLANGSESANSERDSEDAEVVIVDLIPQAGVADLVEPFELIEADGIPIGHEHAMEHDGQTGLAEGIDLLGFAEQLRTCRESTSAGGHSSTRRLRAGTRPDL